MLYSGNGVESLLWMMANGWRSGPLQVTGNGPVNEGEKKVNNQCFLNFFVNQQQVENIAVFFVQYSHYSFGTSDLVCVTF